MDITISADAVAWYGAIVATLSAIAGGWAVWRDRVKLKVNASANMQFTESVRNYSEGVDYIVIDVANVGRRPVHLTAPAWLTTRGSDMKFMFVGCWEPKGELGDGESAKMLAKQGRIDLSQVAAVCVKDATGRVWKGRLEKPHRPAD